MNIHTVLGGDHAFDSDEVAILVLAYENALRELRLADREDPATLLVVHKIIDLAKLGERNPDRLRRCRSEGVEVAATLTDSDSTGISRIIDAWPRNLSARLVWEISRIKGTPAGILGRIVSPEISNGSSDHRDCTYLLFHCRRRRTVCDDLLRAKHEERLGPR